MTVKKDVKRIPQLRFSEFEGEWKETRLDEVFSILNGYAFSSNDAQNSGCRWVKIADVGINEMKTDTLSYLPMSFQDKYKNFRLNKDDFVIALTRPILSGKLKIAKVGKLFDGALLNQRVGKLISTNVREYVYHFLQCVPVINKIENRIAGSDPPNLSPNEIGSIRTYIADSPEQEKIASFLSAVDKKIQQLTRKKEQLEQYKKGVMQKIFSQEIRFTDDNGKDYPDWQEKKLGDIFRIRYGKDYKHLNEGDVPVFGTGGIMTYVDTYLYDKPSVLIGRKGSINAPQFTEKPFWTVDTLFYTEINNEYEPFFVYQVVSLINWMKYNEATGVPSLNTTSINSVKVEVPALFEEQVHISKFLRNIEHKIATVQSQLNQTQTFKKGLLQQLFV